MSLSSIKNSENNKTENEENSLQMRLYNNLGKGTEINLSDEELIVTAVGPVANENFVNLGHLVLKLDSATEAALPGDVSCSYTNVPEIKIDDRIEIN